MDESSLIRLAAQGDQDAFTDLVKRYLRYIYTIAYKVTLSEEDARDVTQEVLVRLAQSIGQYQEIGQFRAWLARMTINRAIDFQRKTYHREQSTEDQVLIQLYESSAPARSASPRDAYEESRQWQQVEKAMQVLSPQQRAILYLRLKEDLGPKEIAQQLSLPAEQVRVQMHRSIHKIREHLYPFFKEEVNHE